VLKISIILISIFTTRTYMRLSMPMKIYLAVSLASILTSSLTTVYALSLGYIEVNPFARILIDRLGLIGETIVTGTVRVALTLIPTLIRNTAFNIGFMTAWSISSLLDATNNVLVLTTGHSFAEFALSIHGIVTVIVVSLIIATIVLLKKQKLREEVEKREPEKEG